MSSAFTNCKNQNLIIMFTEQPLQLFVDPIIKPVAIHKTAVIPIHLKVQVKADLDRDVRLGIFEKVDLNSPVQWLSRMIVTLKKDGTPHRIIDYKRLNDAIPRQTNVTQSPFFCASACPPGKQKTLFDAKDGYHSVIVAEADRAATEFLCEFGCYRCVGLDKGLYDSAMLTHIDLTR